MIMIWDENKQPVPTDDLAGWVEFMQGDRHVGVDEIGPFRISTVFLGFNTGWTNPPSECYETMIFVVEDWPAWLSDTFFFQRRYNSLEDAEFGHYLTVQAALLVLHYMGVIAQPRLTVDALFLTQQSDDQSGDGKNVILHT